MTITDALRRAARITALAVPAALLLVTAAPAVADTPSQWEQAEPLSTLDVLLLFVGGPLALVAIITLLVMGPSLVRGDRNQRGVASWTEPAWFGSEVTRTEQAPHELDSGSESQTGGASARW